MLTSSVRIIDWLTMFSCFPDAVLPLQRAQGGCSSSFIACWARPSPKKERTGRSSGCSRTWSPWASTTRGTSHASWRWVRRTRSRPEATTTLTFKQLMKAYVSLSIHWLLLKYKMMYDCHELMSKTLLVLMCFICSVTRWWSMLSRSLLLTVPDTSGETCRAWTGWRGNSTQRDAWVLISPIWQQT